MSYSGFSGYGEQNKGSGIPGYGVPKKESFERGKSASPYKGHTITVFHRNGSWQAYIFGPHIRAMGPPAHSSANCVTISKKAIDEAEKLNPQYMETMNAIKAQKAAILKQKQDEHACRRAAMTPEQRQKEDDESYLRGKGMMKWWNGL